MRKFVFAAFLFLVLSASVFAQENSELVVEFADPDFTPEDGWRYRWDLWKEDWSLYFADTAEEKLELEGAYLAERLAEVKYLIDNGNYKDAQIAAGNAEDVLNNYEEHIKEYSGSLSGNGLTYSYIEGSENSALEQLIDYKEAILNMDSQVEAVQSDLIMKVEDSSLDEETAALLINELKESTVEVEIMIEDQQEEIIMKTAEQSGITELEVKLAVEEKENEMFGEVYESKIDTDEIIALGLTIEEIKDEIKEAREAGEDTSKAEQLLENAELHLAKCEEAFSNGEFGEAYGQLTAAEHLALNVDKYVKEEVDSDDLESLIDLPEEVNEEEMRQYKQYVSDYETAKERLIEKYPEKAELIEREYERAVEVSDLMSGINDQIAKLYEEYSSLPEDEKNAKVHEFVSEEYQRVYGKEYVPPGTYVKIEEAGENQDSKLGVIGIGRIEMMDEVDPETGEVKRKVIGWYDGAPVNDFEAGGGFVLDKEYENADGYKYEFKKNEQGQYYYEYTTPMGVEHEVILPSDYDPILTFERGEEVHSIDYESDDGEKIKAEYSATGYEIESMDGTKILKDSYDEGKHEVIGGGEISIDPAVGYTYEAPDGKAVLWTYNPEYKNYYDPTTGKTFVPEVPSSHLEKTYFAGSEDKYRYDYGGSQYYYDPKDNSWTMPDNQKIYPNVAPAPVGYESYADNKEYTTPHGEKWKFEEGTWKAYNEKGEVEKSYTPAPNNYYSYDSERRAYVDNYGKMHGSESSVTAPDGKVWDYDNVGGVWKSGGESYNPTTGEYSGGMGGEGTRGSGQEGEEPKYGYYYDSSGSSQTYSYSGGYYVQTPSGDYGYFNPNYRVEGGVAKQEDMQGNTWTQDASTGTWSCGGCSSQPGTSSSGSYGSGAYSGGGYSGGYSSESYGSGGYSSGGYPGGPGSYYPGTSSSGGGMYGGGYDSSGNYVGGSYGGYDSSGSYVGTDSSGGSSTGGDSGGSTGESSTGGDSGGSAPSGDGGGGGTTGGVIREFRNVITGKIISTSKKFRIFRSTR